MATVAFPQNTQVDRRESALAVATAFNFMAKNAFVGDLVAPIARVETYDGFYWKSPLEMNVGQGKDDYILPLRGHGVTAEVASTKQTYAFDPREIGCKADAREIEEQIRKGAPNPIIQKLQAVSVELITLKERLQLGIFTDASVTNAVTLGAGQGWNQYSSATSDPLQDVTDACELIFADTAIDQAFISLVMSKKTFRVLQNHPDVQAVFTPTNSMGVPSEAMVAMFLGVREIITSPGGYVLLSGAISRVMDDTVGLFIRNDVVTPNEDLTNAPVCGARWLHNSTVSSDTLYVTSNIDNRNGAPYVEERRVFLPGGILIQIPDSLARISNTII